MKLGRLLIAVALSCSFGAVALGDEKKVDKTKFAEGSCCAKADKAGKECKHPCCAEAAKKAEVCTKCNKPKEESKGEEKKPA